MRWLRISLFTVAGIFAILLTAIAVLLAMDLGVFKDRIETAATEFLGRELRIDGVLHANLGASIEVYAEEFYLANPDWAEEKTFVAAEKIDIAVNAWSLINGPIRFERIEINGVRVNIEKNDSGAASWTFEALAQAPGEEPEEAPADETVVGRMPVMLSYAAINDTKISYSTSTMAKPLLFVVESLASSVKGDQLTLSLTGSLNGTPLHFEKNTGSIDNLISYRDVTVDLNGNIGEIEIQGSVWADDLLHPRRPLIDLKINGPSAQYLTELLLIEPITSGPLDLSISVRESDERMMATLEGKFGEFIFDISGQFKDIQELNEIDLNVSAEGPDIGSIIRLAGGEYAELDAFSIHGKIVRSGPEVSIENVQVTIGENKLTIGGKFADFPTANGANLTLAANGPDFGRFNKLLGMPGRLGGAFTTTLDVSPHEDGRTLIELNASAEHVRIQLHSLLSKSEQFADSTVQLNISGKDISIVAAAAGFEGLPGEKFEIAGSVEKNRQGYLLKEVRALVGDDLLRIDGQIGDRPLAGDTDFEISISGSDVGASFIALGASADRLPKGAYHLTGRVQKQDDKLWLRNIESTIGDNDQYQLEASGFLTIDQELRDSQISLRAKGASLAALAEMARVEGIPDFPFEIRSDIRRGTSNTHFENGFFSSGIVEVEFAGFVGDKPLEDDLQFKFTADVPRMREVIAEFGVDVSQIPTGDLVATGSLQSESGKMSLEALSLIFEGTKLDASGNVGQLPDLDGTSVRFTMRGEDLSRLLPPEIPGGALTHDFSVEGRVELNGNFVEVDGLSVQVGQTSFGGDFRFMKDPIFQSGGFSLKADSPDIFKFFPKLIETSVPQVAIMKFRGGGDWSDNHWNFDDVRLDLGEGFISLTGGIDEPPSFDRTDLDIEVFGSSIRDMSVIAGRELPDHSWHLTARLLGSEDLMTMENFALTFGESDLQGDFSLQSGDLPAVKIDVTSKLFDIAEYQPEPEESSEPPPVPGKDRKVIPDTAIPLEFLRSFDAEINIDIEQLRTRASIERGVNLTGRLSGGALQIENLSTTSQRGGFLQLSADLKPDDSGGAEFALTIDGEDLIMGFMATTEEEVQHMPLFELRADLAAEGATVSDLAGSLDGYFRLVGSSGRLKSGSFSLFTQDFVTEVINTVNPFAKSDPYTNVECAVVLLQFDDGAVKGKPALVQKTDKLLIFANTEIDLKTEKVLANFKMVPQKGLGISVSSLVNPYIAVTGTLANPSLVLDPESVLIEGGIAVATVGLSVLAKGLKNRFLSDKDPCGTAVAKADEEFKSPRDGD